MVTATTGQFTTNAAVVAGQVQYYIEAAHAVAPVVKYTLNLTGEGLTATPAAGEIVKDTEVTVTVVAPAGKQVATFIIGGVDQKASLVNNQYTFTMTSVTDVLVTYEDIPAVTVENVSVTNAMAVTMGQALELTATVTPENATNKEVVWTVANGTGEATIAGNMLTPVKAGTVIVTATNAASGVTGTKVITVVAAPVPMEVSATVPTFTIGVPETFTVGTIANSDSGKMVRAHFAIPAGVTVEYQEGGQGAWLALVDVFGPVTGFPLGDITSTFRGTFTAEGTKTVKVEFKEVGTEKVLGSKDITAKVVVAPADIVPATKVYDRYTYATLDIPMTLNGNTLTKISDGSDLTLGTDYTVAGNTVILAKAYMQAKAVGNVTLTFTFSAGANGICVITVSDSTPAPVTVLAVSNEAELNAALINPTITTINITASFQTTKKINVSRPVVINGGEKTITVSRDLGADNSSKHALGIQAKGVKIKDLTINSASKAYGVQTYGDASATLENVAITNSKGAGLTVNGSNVIATNLNTIGNAWGGVNVDPGSGVDTPSVFTLDSGLLAEATQIWSDGEHVSATATVMVNASVYTLSTYTPNYTGAVVDSGRIWTNRPSIVLVEDIAITSAGDATTVVNGGTLQMSAIVTPSNATDKTIIWSVIPGTGTAFIDASTGFLATTGVGTVNVIATNVASGVASTKVIEVIAAESNRIIITPSLGAITVKQGNLLIPSDTVLSSNYDASGLTTYISLSKSDNAPVNFDTVFSSFNLATKVGSTAFDGPYNMNGPFSTFQYGPTAGYPVAAGVNQVTKLTGAVEATAPVGVYTITTEVKSGTTVVASSSYILTVTIGQN